MAGGGVAKLRPARRTRELQRARSAWLAIAAVILAVAGVLAPARAPLVAAAGDGPTLATSATYTVVPARQVVQVGVDLTARNDLPNTPSGAMFFYEGAKITIQAAATHIRATSGGSRLTISVKPGDGFAILEVRFRKAIFFHETATTRITYELPGAAPRSASNIRVGSAFATFVAWAFGDSGSVRIVIPPGFNAETSGSVMTRSTSGATTVFRAASIANTVDWYAVVNADRESALTADRIDLAGGEHVVIRAWPEDPDWTAQVKLLLTTGLPELVRQTGLAWPVTGDLAVSEVHTPLLEGYAGIFLVDQDKIEISEDLDDLTIIHEASHAWFNSGLFEGRWINEGLADTFAARTLAGIGIGGWAPTDVDPTDKAAVRLLTWDHPGRIEDEATDAREQYGYDASWTVIRSLVAEIGDVGFRKVLAAAQARQIPYAGAGLPEAVRGVADWRRLLDLLQEVGGSRTADALFRRWVVTDAQLGILDKRVAARATYAALADRGAGWLAPPAIREPMAAWDFVTATGRMTDATAVLAQRDEIARLARTLGVDPPAALRIAYETAATSLDDAQALAASELDAVQALGRAVAAVDAPRDPIVSLGLVGTAPDLDLVAARTSFSAGTADAAIRATAVVTLMTDATRIGQDRLIAAVLAFLVVLVLVVVAAVVVLRRRRERRSRIVRAAIDPAIDAAIDPAPYATLRGQPGGGPDAAPDGPSVGLLETPPADPAPPVPDTAPATGPPLADRRDAT